MKWRVIRIEEHSAAMNMALDEALCESVKESGVGVIRLYTWKPKAISIGYFQSLAKEVDVESCKVQGVDIVRRRTGGGAVYHDDELTYSVLAPEQWFGGISESYEEICSWVINGFKELGVRGVFSPINDILVGGKKISGNAQTRRDGVLQMHGTILLTVDVDTMFSLLLAKEIKIRDKIIANVKERVTSMQMQGVDIGLVYTAVLHGLVEGKEWEYSEITEKEMERAKALAAEKYGNENWTTQR